MAYTETTRQSYGNKLSNSVGGIIIGLLMFIGGTILLWWNEGNSVKTAKAIKEAQSVAVSIEDINTVNPEFEGKLAYATGTALTLDTLRDENFGVKSNAIKLIRNVEYYQWVEHSKTEKKEKVGGATETVTTYTYDKEWVNEPIKSSDYHDPEYQSSNTVLVTLEDVNQTAENVTFGAYTLPTFMTSSIYGEESVDANMSDDLRQEWMRSLSTNNPLVDVTAKDNVVYFGVNRNLPTVGDVRITFTQVTSPKDISILGKVIGNTFEKYVAKNGKSFSRVEMGTVSAENMFEGAKKENSIWTWVLRVVGIFLVIYGIKSMFSLLVTLFAVLPFLKNVVGAGIGIVCFVIGLVWSLLVIAIAWIAYRPVLAIVLLVVAAALIFLLVSRSKKKKDAAPLTEPAAK